MEQMNFTLIEALHTNKQVYRTCCTQQKRDANDYASRHVKKEKVAFDIEQGQLGAQAANVHKA
ncbi:hypothetical protein [Priestia sp. J2]|uniref:hypothetical protein n=1 Tax=unclassified Priestia TaxID=2800374 RepID=UPI001E3A0AEB|nr:hypothetical protein [Priestia sp. J2]